MTDTTMTLRTVAQFAEQNPAFKQSTIRQLIFYQATNGFAGCFPKVGGSVFVWVEKFYARIREQNAA